MLGSKRLQTFFGAVRPGTNTAGTNTLKSVLHNFADQGMTIMFLQPGTKAPADYRTQKQKDDAQKLAESQGKKPKSGLYLATSDKKLLTQYLKAARAQADGPDNDPNAIGGLTPLNFGIVPDKSRVVVVDCDTEDETNAFRNWVMDHTQNPDLAHHMDLIQPSVKSPGSVRGGEWETVQEEHIENDYDTQVYYPARYQNRGGTVVHSNGGHWYFFYPDDYELPDDAPNKLIVHYDCQPRTELLDQWRSLSAQYTNTGDANIKAQLDQVEQELNTKKQQAQHYADNPAETRNSDGTVKEGFSTFVVMLHSSYVLIPPSSRMEGHYTVSTGTGDLAWEDWLTDLINTNRKNSPAKPEPTPQPETAPLVVDDTPTPPTTNVVQGGEVDSYAALTAFGQESLNEIISAWAWPTAWREILTPHGWTLTGHDNCGCEYYQAPGPHNSPKSATAHGPGCDNGCSELGRLHIWTDNPPEEFSELVWSGKRDFSKMSTLALLEYDGDNAAAIRGVGLELPPLQNADGIASEDFQNFMRDFTDTTIIPPREMSRQEAEQERRARNRVTFTPLGKLGDVEPPKFMVADTIEEKSLSAIIGPAGSGKSFVAIDLACALATKGRWLGKPCRQRKVGYLAGEGMVGVIDRFRAWGEAHDHSPDDYVFIADKLPNINSFDWIDYNTLADTIKSNGIDVIVIDTWSRAIAGADENAAEDTSLIIEKLDRMRGRAECSVIVVHHTAKESSHARGSSVFNAALDTEILVKKVDDPDEEQHRQLISVSVTKQKNAEAWEQERFCQIMKVGEDRVEFDDEDFPVTIQAPAVVGDLEGGFGAADGLGGSWFLDDDVEFTPIPLPPQSDIVEQIYQATHNRRMGATESQIVSAACTQLSHGQPVSYKLKEEVTRILHLAVVHRMVVHKNSTRSKFVIPRPGMPMVSPDELVELLKAGDRKKGSSHKGEDSQGSAPELSVVPDSDNEDESAPGVSEPEDK